MKTGTKVMAGYGVAIGLMALLGGVAVWAATGIGAALANVGEAKLPSLDAVWELNEAHTAAARAVNALIVGHSDPEKARGQLHAALDRMTSAKTAYEALPHTDGALALWREAQARLGVWRAQLERILPLVEARVRLGDEGNDPARRELEARLWPEYGKLRAAFDPADAAMFALLARTRDDAARAREEGATVARDAIAAVVGALLGGAILLVVFGARLARGISRTLRRLVAEAARLRGAVEAGRLAERGDAAAIDAEFRPIIEGINATMDAYARPIAVTADVAARIARGDVPPPITERYEGDFDAIKDALNRCIAAVNRLVEDSALLARAGVEGRLATRADPSRHEGDFRRIVDGFNASLDAVVAPIAETARHLEGFARGELPAPIAAEWRGDFDAVKRNVNTLTGVLGDLIAAMERLTREGAGDAVVDVDRFRGAWRTMAEATGEMAEDRRVVRAAMDVVGEISRGRFAAPMERLDGKRAFIGETVELLRTNLAALIDDVDALAGRAVAGELAARADAGRHPGDYRKIADGLNRTLDAVIAPVDEAAAVLERLAARDLRARVERAYQGDHARLAEALNGTAAALEASLAQVHAAAEQVSSAATQIASSSQSVAAGASEQASAIEETSASLDSVAATTRGAAEHAQQANAVAQRARAAATEGATAVEQLQGAMGRVRKAAEDTSQIIKDVSEIAFQTNLLALNAAVEAARAGDAGRGFAVVAEEVRSLALRAKEAAGRTEDLIRQSLRETGAGEGAAREVAGKLGEIVGGVEQVTGLVEEIAAAAKEQAAGIDQVTVAVAEMDKVTQQNAASAEESSSAAAELTGQAEELAAMVGSFQLASAADSRASPPGRIDFVEAGAAGGRARRVHRSVAQEV